MKMLRELLKRSTSIRIPGVYRPTTISDDRVRLVSEVAGLGTYEADLVAGRIAYSPELCAIFGIEAEYESTIEESYQFVHPLDRGKARTLVDRNRLAPDQQTIRAELRIVRPDGEVRWILWSSRTFFSETPDGPMPVRTVGAVMDITARKRAEESLRRSEERLWLAIRAADLGTWDWDVSSNRITASVRCRQLLHLSASTPVDRETYFGNVHPDDRQRLSSAVTNALTSEIDFHEDIRVLCPAGRLTWVDLRGRTRYDDDGKPIRMTGIVSDITETKQAEHALRESERKFRAFFHNAGVGMAQCDAMGWFTDVNERLCRNLGYSCDELVQKRLYDLVHPDDRPRYWKHFTELMHQQLRSTSSIEMRCLRRDGSVLWVQVTGAAITNEDGSAVSSVKVVEDITERKMAVEALLRSEKLASVGRMATTMAHELNNPLAAAINSVYLALSDQSLSPRSREALSIVDKELARLAQLANQAIGFYREVGQPSRSSIERIMNQVLELNETKLSNKSIRVLRKYRAVPPVLVIEGELRQAISNLVTNAFDSLGLGGMLVVSTAVIAGRDETPMVRITVADNGSGIPKEHLGHIFEAFFTTKPDFGTGLGLWVTHELVKKQSGHIRIRSQVNKGTVASIWLPVERRLHPRAAA